MQSNFQFAKLMATLMSGKKSYVNNSVIGKLYGIKICSISKIKAI